MSLNNRYLQIGILVLVWALIYLGTISSPALFDDADSIHAEAVREMVTSGDWTTLRINNGFRYLEKAPLMYWMSAASVTVFGLSDWAVRLPVALFALFVALLLFRFGCRFFGENAGFYAALVYVTSLGPFAFTRIYLPDVILAFFMTFSFYLYLRVVFEPEKAAIRFGSLDLRCMGIFVAAAFAVLAKGLIGIVFTGAVIFVHLVVSGRWSVLKRLQIIPGIIVFILIAAPWHIAAGLANNGFFWFYFMNEHFLRYLGLRYPKDYDTVPLWLFWTLHLVWLFPWTAFLWGIGKVFPKSFRPKEPMSARINVFLLVWILTILTFFMFSTTQEYYTFPTLPSFSLLVGQVLAWMTSSDDRGVRKKALISLSVFSFIGLVIGGGLFMLAWIGAAKSGVADLSDTLTVNPEQYALSFGHMHDLTPATFAHLAPLVYRTAFAIALGPMLALAAFWRKRRNLSMLFLGLTMVWLLHSYQSGMVAFEPILSSKGLAKTIEYHYKPGDRIVVNGVYERGSSINYYTGLQLSILNGQFGNLWYGSFYPDSARIFFDDEGFLRAWSSPERIFFFSEEEPLRDFLKRHPDFAYRNLAEEGGKKVLVNW